MEINIFLFRDTTPLSFREKEKANYVTALH